MLPKYLFFLAFGTLLLSGCGLETDEDTDEESDSVTSVEVDVDQNVYLPLTNATSLFYTADEAQPGDIEGTVSYDVGMSNNEGYPVYKIAINSDGLSLDLYFRSTINQIELLGIDGPISVSDTASFDFLRFDTPIKLVGERSNQSTEASATLESDDNSISNASITVAYDVANSSTATFESFHWTTLELPTLQSTLTAEISASIPGVTVGPFPVTLDFFFAEGLGLVQHSGDVTAVAGNEYEIKFYGLEDLPNIVAFNQEGTTVEGSLAYFSIAEESGNSTIESSDYEIVNLSALNDLGWLEITEPNSGEYAVGINTVSTELPDTLTSVQVLFENRVNSGERLSANLTLLAP